MNILVNGDSQQIVEQHLSYEQVVVMAGFSPERILSVTYHTRRKGDEQREGVITPSRSVLIEEGMVFDVADTSNA